MGQNDADRFQRIRDEQIKARDPGPSKIRGYDWQQHAERGRAIKASRKAQKKPLLIELFLLLPARWRGAIIGTVVGLIAAIPMALLLDGEWALLAVIPLVVCGLVGFVLGATVWEDDVA